MSKERRFLIIVLITSVVLSFYSIGQLQHGFVPCVSWGGCECRGDFELGGGEAKMFCWGHGIDPWRLEGYFRCVVNGTNVTASDCEKWTYDELSSSGGL
ncbi:MAG: hypothetical protein ACUVQU_06015, partial [Candidatus Bipolaricaulia bacterium]